MNFPIEHLGLPAWDPAKLKDWYVQALGGQVIYQDGKTPPAFFVQLPGGLKLEIYQAKASSIETSDNQHAGWRHVALRVHSIEAARAEMERRGVQFTDAPGPAGGGGRVLFFRDAEGNLLHLVERPEGSPLR
jgi:glyoxylase I family protein